MKYGRRDNWRGCGLTGGYGVARSTVANKDTFRDLPVFSRVRDFTSLRLKP